MGRALIFDSAEKPPFIVQKFYDRTVAINGQSVSSSAGAYEKTGISLPDNRPTSGNVEAKGPETVLREVVGYSE